MTRISQILAGVLFSTLGALILPNGALAVVQNLNGQTGQTQTFSNDTNVRISSSGNVHSLGWQGLLPLSRGGTGASSFTAGSVLFSNGTSISQNNTNLFWDNLNNRLGIGTASPANTLDVAGNASISGNLNVSGNISGNVTAANLVPYTGATNDIDLGNHSITLGIQNGSGSIFGVNAIDNSNANGGVLRMLAGTGKGGGSGGYIEIQGGPGGNQSGRGGSVYFIGGNATAGDADGGDVSFRTGQKSGTGSHGLFTFSHDDNVTRGILDFSLLNSSDKTFTFPNTSGTFGILGIDQTWSGLNRFEAGTNSTIYVGSSVKSGCIAMGDSDGDGVTYITANDGALTASATKPTVCQ